MPRIQALPEVLANQIAAGEVVERPASVIKELLENALDGGANDIGVVVEGGGIILIQVRDNGVGVHGDDLPLALTRHATSKIRDLRDLEEVASMGFRGEALPSIASISRLELISRTAATDTASRIEVAGGASDWQVAPIAHPVGTTVSMRDLFFNTPVRRRFLRTEKTEFRHLEDALRRIALSRFDVAFRLRHNGRDLWSVRPAESPRAAMSRLERLCGRAFADAAIALEAEAGDMRLNGWVGAPDAARRQADQQFFFVNHRAVRDQVVRHAIRQAFDDLLAPDMQPTYVLYLDIEPILVDVNVHPTKHEVRFREARMVHDFLHQAVRRALSEDPVLPGTVNPPGVESITGDMPNLGPDRRAYHADRGQPGGNQLAGYRFLYGATPAGTAEQRPTYGSDPASAGSVSTGSRIILVSERYALVCEPPAPKLVDLNMAVGIVLRHRLRAALANGAPARRPLLIPHSASVAEPVVHAVETNSALLAHMGFDLRVVGPTTVSLRQVPLLLAEFSPDALADALVAVVPGMPGSSAGVDVERPASEAFERLVASLAEPAQLPVGDEHAAFISAVLADLEECLAGESRAPWVVLDERTLGKLFSRAQD